MNRKKRVLFYCKHNSCRSQMAEAYLKQMAPDRFEVYSAGLYPQPIHPLVYRVMEEEGIDLGSQTPKNIDVYLGRQPFDFIVIVCQEGEAECPRLYPFALQVERWPLADPAQAKGDAQEKLQAFRHTRNQIQAQLNDWLKKQDGKERKGECMKENPFEQSEKIKEAVRQGYTEISQGQSSCCCCGSSAPQKLAEGIGYTREELELLPEGANMGLSCGNPTALANLRPGQVVLDLGSGGGFDVFIAAGKVGPQGKAIGVDMTAAMLSKSRASIAAFTQKTGLANVEFRLGEIEHLPVADASIDVVISNCVINLLPDKQQVWNEIARVLKPGGRACVSDLALKKPLPPEVRQSAAALVSCVAGAVLVEETRKMAAQAGLHDIQVEEKVYNLDVLADCNDPLYRAVKEALPAGATLSDYIVSINVTACKK